MNAAVRAAPVGVFDSGVGGLSVLRHIRAQLPHEALLYFADSGFAPYGDKPEAVVVARVLQVVDFLLAQGVKALVVACNTATVAAIAQVRARHPGLPVVGVEPGLKPAAAQSRKVGVLATDRTLAGEKFLQLREQVSRSSGTDFVLQGCSGLVEHIERGELDSPATRALLRQYLQPMLSAGVDTIVLGCTHYPFVSDAIRAEAAALGHPTIALVDTGDAVARQLGRLLREGELSNPATVTGSLRAYTTGTAASLHSAFHTLLGLDIAVQTREPHSLAAAVEAEVLASPPQTL
ncbi:glutamate racemase [Massilia sp. TS11]|uniref:glutamate racemase n=1 Tax=Massilia sp. TS11 TaxID=2908003 RepID=UPI001EDC61CD|nr:glutamate racemase [Massilia sp. TS11]